MIRVLSIRVCASFGATWHSAVMSILQSLHRPTETGTKKDVEREFKKQLRQLRSSIRQLHGYVSVCSFTCDSQVLADSIEKIAVGGQQRRYAHAGR